MESAYLSAYNENPTHYNFVRLLHHKFVALYVESQRLGELSFKSWVLNTWPAYTSPGRYDAILRHIAAFDIIDDERLWNKLTPPGIVRLANLRRSWINAHKDNKLYHRVVRRIHNRREAVVSYSALNVILKSVLGQDVGTTLIWRRDGDHSPDHIKYVIARLRQEAFAVYQRVQDADRAAADARALKAFLYEMLATFEGAQLREFLKENPKVSEILKVA